MSGLTHDEETLLNIVLENQIARDILDSNPFPNGEPWYLAAGGIVQSAWNHLSGYEITRGIEDYDLVYYDPVLGKEREQAHEDRIQAQLEHIKVKIDVTNEAGVHEWFEDRFGVKLEQYPSCEDAIASWNPCAAVGITKIGQEYKICAPHGLSDTLGMTMRPNKMLFPQHAYEVKAKKWSAKWPKLTVIPW